LKVFDIKKTSCRRRSSQDCADENEQKQNSGTNHDWGMRVQRINAAEQKDRWILTNSLPTCTVKFRLDLNNAAHDQLNGPGLKQSDGWSCP
jgi:hypothetical protein